MGDTLSKKRKYSISPFQNFRPSDWSQLKNKDLTHQEINHLGEYITLQNKITKQEIDLYQLYFQNRQELNVYIDCFAQRTRQEYLVNTIYLQPLRSNNLCSSFFSVKCYIQHMPIRLSNITDIPFYDTLYILWGSLNGFQKLFNMVGYFSILQDHVCIDKQGHVRVWMNSDLSKNYPQGFQDVGLSLQRQNTMVDEIFEIIFGNSEQINSEQNNGLITFDEYLQEKGKKSPTFKQAIYLFCRYLKDFDIQLPDYCQSIIEIFNEEGDDYFLQNNDSEIQRMLENSKCQSIHSLQHIQQHQLSGFSRSPSLSQKQPRIQQVAASPQIKQINQNSSNNSNYFRNSYKKDHQSQLNVIKNNQKQKRSSNRSHHTGYRKSLKNRNSITSNQIYNHSNCDNSILSKKNQQINGINGLQMSEIYENQEIGLNLHHRLPSNYQCSYQTSNQSYISSNQQHNRRISHKQQQFNHMNNSKYHNSHNNYIQNVDQRQFIVSQSTNREQDNYYSLKSSRRNVREQEKPNLNAYRSNNQQQIYADQRNDNIHPYKIKLIYADSLYNGSSNCNSLRDNNFSPSQLNNYNQTNFKLRKKSEDIAKGLQFNVFKSNESTQRLRQVNDIDPQILADLMKIKGQK